MAYKKKSYAKKSYRKAAPKRRTASAQRAPQRLVIQVVAAPQGTGVPVGYAAAPAPRGRRF